MSKILNIVILLAFLIPESLLAEKHAMILVGDSKTSIFVHGLPELNSTLQELGYDPKNIEILSPIASWFSTRSILTNVLSLSLGIYFEEPGFLKLIGPEFHHTVSTKKNIQEKIRRFDALTRDDHLTIYMLGHGAEDGSFILERDSALKISELQKFLSELNKDLPVTVVTFQCFGGMLTRISSESLTVLASTDENSPARAISGDSINDVITVFCKSLKENCCKDGPDLYKGLKSASQKTNRRNPYTSANYIVNSQSDALDDPLKEKLKFLNDRDLFKNFTLEQLVILTKSIESRISSLEEKGSPLMKQEADKILQKINTLVSKYKKEYEFVDSETVRNAVHLNDYIHFWRPSGKRIAELVASKYGIRSANYLIDTDLFLRVITGQIQELTYFVGKMSLDEEQLKYVYEWESRVKNPVCRSN